MSNEQVNNIEFIPIIMEPGEHEIFHHVFRMKNMEREIEYHHVHTLSISPLPKGAVILVFFRRAVFAYLPEYLDKVPEALSRDIDPGEQLTLLVSNEGETAFQIAPRLVTVETLEPLQPG